ncbi:3-dehydroquinate synthase [Blattabacterium cuenoti]|nr:3-dehydroquinate synthase [Blattabacterium cuenoti]
MMHKNNKNNNQIIYFNEDGYQKLYEYLLNKNHRDYGKNLFILVDDLSYKYCFPILISYLNFLDTSHIIKISPGEQEKNLNTCIFIWKNFEKFKANRSSVLINLGGGVITDIGGFSASVFKRGIRFINIPTTLLGMVDASIGNKTGINFGNIKNEIGSFYHPELLIIDPNFLKTLSKYEIISGQAEMIKHGLIFDKSFWIKLTKELDDNIIPTQNLIYESILIKTNIVEKDPTEIGLRKILNFGHTIGHALESLFMKNPNKKYLLHGVAIAMGMIYESWISYKINDLHINDYQEIKYFILNKYSLQEIINQLSNDDINDILLIMEHDKKNENNKFLFSLLKEIGYCSYNCAVPISLIKESFFQVKTNH